MIVVHMDTMPDTSLLKAMYEGIGDVKVLYNPSRKEVIEVLQVYPTETLMCIGHGTSVGLFNKSWNGYVMDGLMKAFLQSR